MLVIKIDCLHPESPQAALAGPAHVIRFAIHSAPSGVIGIADDTILRSDNNLLTASTNSFADQLFVSKWSVHIGGVEEVNAKLQRTMNRGQRLIVITSAVEFRHPHAAQAHGGNREPAASQFASLHKCLPIENVEE